MKIVIALFLLAIGASATAEAKVCADYWGNRAYLEKISSTKIRLSFAGGKYPASGNLSYNGERSVSYYFRNGMNTMAEIEKTVFSNGTGKIWYHYPDNSSDHQREKLAIFTCR